MQTNRLLLAIIAIFVPVMGVTSAFAQDWQGGSGVQQAPRTYNAPPGWPQQDPTNTYSSTYPANTPQQMGGGQAAMQAQPRPAAAASPQDQVRIGQWFAAYDQIRHAAQMSPQEKAYSDKLLSSKLSMFIPGPEKVAAQNLLGEMVTRYDKASGALRGLQSLPQTLQLQKGYYQYFTTARGLFADYLKVQQNVLATDQSGNPIAASLMPRKMQLEQLEAGVKQLDAQLRSQYGVRPYAW